MPDPASMPVHQLQAISASHCPAPPHPFPVQAHGALGGPHLGQQQRAQWQGPPAAPGLLPDTLPGGKVRSSMLAWPHPLPACALRAWHLPNHASGIDRLTNAQVDAMLGMPAVCMHPVCMHPVLAPRCCGAAASMHPVLPAWVSATCSQPGGATACVPPPAQGIRPRRHPDARP